MGMPDVCWSSKDIQKVQKSWSRKTLPQFCFNPMWICRSDVLPQMQNTQGSLSIFLYIIDNKFVSLAKKRMFLLSTEHVERLKISADLFFLLTPQTVFNYSALKLTCRIIKQKSGIDAKYYL